MASTAAGASAASSSGALQTLAELTRKKFMDMMISVEPAEGNKQWKALVVDDVATSIISSGCGMYNLIEASVSICEPLKLRREPLRSMEAIYFLTPTKENVEELIHDFDCNYDERREIIMYAAAHVFFSSRLPDSLFNLLTQASLRRHIKTFKELNLEYWMFESQVFHLHMPELFAQLYSEDQSRINTVLRKISNRLSTVCCTLGQKPYIRYDGQSSRAKSISKFMQTRVDEIKGLGAGSGDERPLFFIVDRTVDAVAPLLHEVTYQAMAVDLLPIAHKSTDQYEYMSTGNSGEQVKRTAQLQESDPLWEQLRHMHIHEAVSKVVSQFNKFVKENRKTANLAKRQVKNLKEMAEAVRSLPQYQDMLSKYALHVNMTDACFHAFKDNHLEDIVEIEQQMVGGSKGRRMKSSIQSILLGANYEVSDEIKRRLVQLLALTGNLDLAKENAMDVDLTNLDHVAETMGNQVGISTASSSKGKKESRGKQESAEELEVYEPRLKHLVRDLIEQRLSPVDFPFISSGVPKDLKKYEPRPSGSSSGSKRKSKKGTKSLKSGGTLPAAAANPSGWGAKRESVSQKNNDVPYERPKTHGRRIIVFVLGGVSYSEMRAMYELTRQYQRQVTIGSTHITNPNTYSEQLSKLQ